MGINIFIGYKTAGLKSSCKKVILITELLALPDSLMPLAGGLTLYASIKFTAGKLVCLINSGYKLL